MALNSCLITRYDNIKLALHVYKDVSVSKNINYRKHCPIAGIHGIWVKL